MLYAVPKIGTAHVVPTIKPLYNFMRNITYSPHLETVHTSLRLKLKIKKNVRDKIVN